MKRLTLSLFFSLLVITTGLLLLTIVDTKTSNDVAYLPEAQAACDPAELNRIETTFQQMVQRRTDNPAAVPDDDYKATALDYINSANTCYETTIAPSLQAQTEPVLIDEGGVWFPGYGPTDDGLSGQYVLDGTKWGASGLGTPGGTVTYSYMPQGVSHAVEGLGGNTHISNLNGFSSCFYTEIEAAFAAWSAVADIDFVEVADNGRASNAYGAVGDIRIGAHSFDGTYGTLAHAYYPPPNGTSIAGDIHLDNAELWSCTPGSNRFDIGLVVLHELGHSLGLRHEIAPPTAVMNPTYNPSLTGLLPDDMNGIVEIYGVRPPNAGLTSDIFPVMATTTRITYTLRIHNSSVDLTNVQINNTIPNSTTYVNGSASDGGSEPVADTLVWPATTLGENGTLVRTFQVSVTETITDGQVLINHLTVTYNEGEDVNQQFFTFVNPEIVYLPLILR